MARKQVAIPLDYTPDFLAFWLLYPPQLSNSRWFKPGKWEAFLVWNSMSEAQKAHAMYSVKLLRECKKDGRFVPHARTWLNQRGYDDWNMPEEKGQSLPASMTNILKTADEKPLDVNERRNLINKQLRVKPWASK